MAPSGFLRVSLLLLLLLTVGLLTAEAVTVIVGDQFEFPSTCDRGQSGSLMHLREDGNRPVADFISGEWKPVGEYRDRIRENSSRIVFTQTQYFDGRGIYELTCGETEQQLIQLQVVFAAEVSVTRGEAALLPCYFNIIKPGSSVIWEKDGTVLCELKSGSDVCNKRLSVSLDFSSHGNLSLTLDQAQPEDQGDYFCFIQDGLSNNQSGSPAAVRLEVRDTDNQIRTILDPEVRDTDNWLHSITKPEQPTPKAYLHDLIVISILAALLFVVLCVIIIISLLIHRSRVAAEARALGTSSMEFLCSSPAVSHRGQKHY